MKIKTPSHPLSVGELNQAFGQNLKALRKSNHLSQAKLAAKLGISRATLANYESGRTAPPYWLAEQIAAYFQVVSLHPRLINCPNKDEWTKSQKTPDKSVTVNRKEP